MKIDKLTIELILSTIGSIILITLGYWLMDNPKYPHLGGFGLIAAGTGTWLTLVPLGWLFVMITMPLPKKEK